MFEACLPHAAGSRTIKFLFLSVKRDPDNFVREEGTEALIREVYNTVPPSHFLLQVMTEDLDLCRPEGRAHAQYEAKPLLNVMPAGGLRLQIVRSLADMTSTTPADIEALCDLHNDPAQADRMTQKRPRMAHTASTALEQRVLRLLMRYPALVARLDADAHAQLTAPRLPQGEVLMTLLGECGIVSPEVHFGAFVERLRQTPYVETFVGLHTAVLQDDIELESTIPEFDTVV